MKVKSETKTERQALDDALSSPSILKKRHFPGWNKVANRRSASLSPVPRVSLILGPSATFGRAGSRWRVTCVYFDPACDLVRRMVKVSVASTH